MAFLSPNQKSEHWKEYEDVTTNNKIHSSNTTAIIWVNLH